MSTFVTLQHTIRRWLATVRRYGVDLSPDHAIALSGAGLRTYFFDPEDNYNWAVVHPDVSWMPEALTVDNYGAFEALRVHTGHSFRTWDTGKAVERLAVIKRELDEGRVMLHTAPDGTEGVLADLRNDRLEMTLLLEDGEGHREHKLGSLRDPDAVEANLGVFVTIGPEREDSKPRRRHALKADLLTWFPRHARSQKELGYRDEVYFASGARGLVRFARRYSDQAWRDLDPEETAWVKHFVAELSEGRSAVVRAIRDGLFDDVVSADAADALSAHVTVWEPAEDLTDNNLSLPEIADGVRKLAEADLTMAAVLDAIAPLSWEEASSLRSGASA